MEEIVETWSDTNMGNKKVVTMLIYLLSRPIPPFIPSNTHTLYLRMNEYLAIPDENPLHFKLLIFAAFYNFKTFLAFFRIWDV